MNNQAQMPKTNFCSVRLDPEYVEFRIILRQGENGCENLDPGQIYSVCPLIQGMW